MTEPLTERQEKILSFIKKSIVDQGYPPTIREIGEHFGIRSTNGVNDHLKALERKGYLQRGELKSRALSVFEGGKSARFVRHREISPAGGGETVEVPVVGKVAAGEPLLAQENITDHVRIDSLLLPESGRKGFARGDRGGHDRGRGHREALLSRGRAHPLPALEPAAQAHLRQPGRFPRDADHRRGGRSVPKAPLSSADGYWTACRRGLIFPAWS